MKRDLEFQKCSIPEGGFRSKEKGSRYSYWPPPAADQGRSVQAGAHRARGSWACRGDCSPESPRLRQMFGRQALQNGADCRGPHGSMDHHQRQKRWRFPRSCPDLLSLSLRKSRSPRVLVDHRRGRENGVSSHLEVVRCCDSHPLLGSSLHHRTPVTIPSLRKLNEKTTPKKAGNRTKYQKITRNSLRQARQRPG
jgi:hypothetical protein